jgi:hypothetical protein
MYTIETLKKVNPSYDYEHRIIQEDVEMVNNWITFIGNSRDKNSPQVGDIVEYTNEHGDFYKNAHIEKIDGYEGEGLHICERPQVPFIGKSNNRFYTSTSGGAWTNIPKNLKLIGQREKAFCDWGHCGACGNGAVNFSVVVNVWEYKEPEPLYKDYSTKTHDKFYVSVLEDQLLREQHNNYKYLIQTNGCTSHTAFKTDKEYQAWLKTFNGVEFDGHWQNQKIVWTHKQISKVV